MAATATEPLNVRLEPLYTERDRVFEFAAPRHVVYGRGAAADAVAHLRPGAAARAFVITDSNLRKAGVGDELITALERAGEVEIFERKPGEPRASEIDEIGEAARAAQPSSIVAIGGGATMDAAKCVRVLVDFGGSVRDYAWGKGVEGFSEIELMAVATTSGTGSETGRGGLYIDDETNEKVGVGAPHLLPDIAVVDPDLTMSVPAATTASTGADALAQAIGPYTGPLRHPIVDAVAFQAIRLISTNLPEAVRDGNSADARAAVAYGSLLSGLAMNNAEAMADQFFDEVLGPRFGIPHGVVAGILLPYVVQFNRRDAEERTASLADAMLAAPAATERERADQVVLRLSQLAEEIGLPTLRSLEVPEADLPLLGRLAAEHIGVEMGLNPRELTEPAAVAILEAAWRQTPPLELDI